MYKRSRVDAEIVLTLRRSAEFLRAFLSASAQPQPQPAAVQLWTALISAYRHRHDRCQQVIKSAYMWVQCDILADGVVHIMVARSDTRLSEQRVSLSASTSPLHSHQRHLHGLDNCSSRECRAHTCEQISVKRHGGRVQRPHPFW